MYVSLLTFPDPADAFSGSTSNRLAIEDLRATVNRRLRDLAPRTRADQLRLRQAIHDALLAPGKRLRPLLMVSAAHDLGYRGSAVLDLGCALEMVHTASLLLDDLPCMDDAKLRRGAPATHVRYGESVAMLAAIGLLSRAYEVVATVGGVTPDSRASLVSILARAVGSEGLVGGQFYDLYSRGAAQPAASTDDLKTGALFVAAVDMVALVARASETQAQGLRQFATELGRAFQLLDDILDGESTAEALGKDVGQDKGKATLAELLGRDGARERLNEHLDALEEALDPIDNGSGSLRSLTQLVFSHISMSASAREPAA